MKANPDSELEIARFLAQTNAQFEKARLQLLQLKAQGLGENELKCLAIRAGLAGVDLDQFCSADTLEKKFACLTPVFKSHIYN